MSFVSGKLKQFVYIGMNTNLKGLASLDNFMIMKRMKKEQMKITKNNNFCLKT